MAAECAADQKAFWPYHDRLFGLTASEGRNGYTVDRLTEAAAELGLDEGEFTTCMIQLEHQETVLASVAQSRTQGINRTPTVVINGTKIADPFSLQEIKTEIDRLLQ